MASGTDFSAAVLQLCAGEDKAANLAVAERLLVQASDAGAQLAVLPEYFNCLGRIDRVIAQAEPIPGPTSESLSALALRHGLWLIAGICEAGSAAGTAHNTLLVFGPAGELVSTYRKIHLFDVDLPGRLTFRESVWITPGDRVRVIETPLARIGLATCYDLRFPELFRGLVDQGAEIVTFASAFFATTGRFHWETLIRARAIENQVYFLASNQTGRHAPRLETYGHSMIVDPWGETVTQLADEAPAVVVGTISRERIAQVRRELPVLTHRRLHNSFASSSQFSSSSPATSP